MLLVRCWCLPQLLFCGLSPVPVVAAGAWGIWGHRPFPGMAPGGEGSCLVVSPEQVWGLGADGWVLQAEKRDGSRGRGLLWCWYRTGHGPSGAHSTSRSSSRALLQCHR